MSFQQTASRNAEAAMAAGKFKDEIVPVEVKTKKKTIVFDTDEGPRPGTTAEALADLDAAPERRWRCNSW